MRTCEARDCFHQYNVGLVSIPVYGLLISIIDVISSNDGIIRFPLLLLLRHPRSEMVRHNDVFNVLIRITIPMSNEAQARLPHEGKSSFSVR